jgi:hypothetical protein
MRRVVPEPALSRAAPTMADLKPSREVMIYNKAKEIALQ